MPLNTNTVILKKKTEYECRITILFFISSILLSTSDLITYLVISFSIGLQDLLHYHVKNSSLTWSDSFEKMETVKKNNNIVENYILKNINLKEVFTAFTQPEYVSSKITFHEI